MYVKTYEFEGNEYGMIDKFSIEDNTYCLFINVNDNDDFFIRKYMIIDGEEYIKKLEQEEFMKFSEFFYERINNLLEKPEEID